MNTDTHPAIPTRYQILQPSIITTVPSVTNTDIRYNHKIIKNQHVTNQTKPDVHLNANTTHILKQKGSNL